MDSLFLFASVLLLDIIGDIDLDAKLVAELIDTRALCTNYAPNEFLVDVELGGLTTESTEVAMRGEC